MAAPDITKIVIAGAANVIFNGVNRGHTDENGVKVSRKVQTVEAFVGQFGKTAVKAFQNGEVDEWDFLLRETDKHSLKDMFPGLTEIASGGVSKLTFGSFAGESIPSADLKLTPFISTNTPGLNMELYNAVPIGDFTPQYAGHVLLGWACKFRGLVAEGRVDGDLVGVFGDATITADLVAPSITIVSPANGSGPGAVAAVVWTASKALDPRFVLEKNPDGTYANVKVVKYAGAVGSASTEVLGAVTYDPGLFQITFTPTVAFTAGSLHFGAFLLDLFDLAGNALPLYSSYFQGPV